MKTKFFAKRILAGSIAAAAALFGGASLHAEDVDIFTTSTTAPKANVLIILDNSSNWSATLGTNSCGLDKLANPGTSIYPSNTTDNTKFSAEICALYNVIGSLGPDVRLGLMMFAETGENGGYVRYGLRSMTDANKTAFKNLIASFVSNGANSDTSGSNQPYGRVMYEAFKYFGGYSSVANANLNLPGGTSSRTQFGMEAYAGGGSSNSTGAKRLDAANNNAATNRAATFYNAVAPFAFLDKNDNVYNVDSAITDNCSKNFIIFLSNGNPSVGGDGGGVATADQLLANLYPGSTPPVIRSGGVEVHASKMDEFAKFLWETDVSSRPGQQRVSTFTFAVYQPQASGQPSNSDQQMINLMKSAADNGGGQPFTVTSAAQLQTELLKLLNDVQAVNSVFVSSSLPVSVNTQGTFLNQVYMGLFRPDGTASPRWLGNLKQYKFIQNTAGDLFLGDAQSPSVRAVNDANGFIKPSAVSFWTTPSSFWTNNAIGTPPSTSDSPDGDMVEKGGTAEQQRIDYAVSQTSRKMLTCSGTCVGVPISFDNTTINGATMQSAFGALTSVELTALVNWVRGEDNFNGTPCNPATTGCLWTSKEKGPGWPTTVRPSIHGDVLHSRPVVLNYANRGPYVFYGANDGALRAVKGGQLGTDGHELWSFIAPEFYSRFKRLRDASPELRTPSTSSSLISSTLPKDYFFDGPIGSYESGSTKWIFVGARRGGAVLYAIDVSDPEAPVIKWKKTQAQLSRLGQTWSLPYAFRKTGVAHPFLIFGAGYDIGEDQTTPVNNGVGRGIYVLDAEDGTELRFISAGPADTVSNPIASDMAILSTKLIIDNDAAESGVYRGYVGDMGGNIWRLDIPSGTYADWKLFKLAALGSDRKFLYAPDVVHAGDKDVVLAGSGDREKPLVSTSQDSFYALYDTANGIGAAISITTLVPADLSLLTSLTTPPSSTRGWYRNLAAGEKVINSPLTVAGVTYFATNKPIPPESGSCTTLGEARAYAVTFNSGLPPDTASGPGTTLSTKILGGGLPPSPIGGVVDLGGGKTVAFVIGAGDKPPEPKRVTLSIPKTRKKVYWNTKSDM